MADDKSKYPEKSYTGTSSFDGGKSKSIMEKSYGSNILDYNEDDDKLDREIVHTDLYKIALHGANIFEKDEIDLYHNMYRFGLYNPYGALTSLKEYLFFTKPDLNIIEREPTTGRFTDYSLAEGLDNLDFWKDLKAERIDIVEMLQNSYSPGWNMLLQNSVISNLEIPGLEGTTIETPVNNYGVGFLYRGTSEASDDSLDFSLEFKDTRWLDVYTFFKAYENYETLKHHGIIAPWRGYTINKVLHDQFAVYKFLVAEDLETIVYWCKLYGVIPVSLPRDAFSSSEISNGLQYSIGFKAAFIEDMTEGVIADFNMLNDEFTKNNQRMVKYQLETYNSETGTPDFRPAKSVRVVKYQDGNSPTGWVYKLKWKGDKQY